MPAGTSTVPSVAYRILYSLEPSMYRCRCILPVSGLPTSVPDTSRLTLTGLVTWAPAAGVANATVLSALEPVPPLWLPLEPEDWQPARTSPMAASRVAAGSRALGLIRIADHLNMRGCGWWSCSYVANLQPLHPIPVAPRGSLLVALHDRGIAHLGLIGVLACVAPCTALAQQVPALVELHLEGAQPLALQRREALADVSLLQTMLLVDQPVDAGHDLPVIHLVRPLRSLLHTRRSVPHRRAD